MDVECGSWELGEGPGARSYQQTTETLVRGLRQGPREGQVLGPVQGEGKGGSGHGCGFQSFAPKVTKSYRQGQPGGDLTSLQTPSSVMKSSCDVRTHYRT